MEPIQFHVEYDPPALGMAHVPIKVAGPGTLTLEAGGLHVCAAKAKTGGLLALFALGTLVFVGFLVAREHLGLGTSGAGLAVTGGLVLTAFLRKKAGLGKPVEYHYPWKSLAKLSYDANKGCLIVVLKGKRPAGGLFVKAPKGAPLEQALRSKLAERG